MLQVYHVRNKMDETGLDMLLDIHGDEELPYNFINGNEVSTKFCSPVDTCPLCTALPEHIALLDECDSTVLLCMVHGALPRHFALLSVVKDQTSLYAPFFAFQSMLWQSNTDRTGT